MGWNGGNEIFDPVARKLLELEISDGKVTEVLTVLIREMQMADWDTEDESFEAFRDNPAVVEAFRRNDIPGPDYEPPDYGPPDDDFDDRNGDE